LRKKQDRIIASVYSRVEKVNHKYGVELPHSEQQAYNIDAKNGNTLWRDALNKEMNNLKVAFNILPHGVSPSPGYKSSSGRINL